MTLGEIESNKQTKSQKKLSKKYYKKALNLLKEYNEQITITEKPSKHLFIGNGGMLCGVCREDLLKLLTLHGSVTELVMLPNKSYSVVSFENTNSAEQAFQTLDGYVIKETTKDEPEVPFYIKYLKAESLDPLKGDITSRFYPVEGGGDGELVNGLILKEEFIDAKYEKELYNFFSTKCKQQQG